MASLNKYIPEHKKKYIRTTEEYRLAKKDFGGSGGDSAFDAWLKADYNIFKTSTNNDIALNKSAISNGYTKSEVNALLNNLTTQQATIYYDKSTIDQMLGAIQGQSLTQDQINQIIAALPDTPVVSPTDLSSAISSAIINSKNYTDDQLGLVKDEVNTTIQGVSSKLSTHMSTDSFKWQNVYDEVYSALVRDAQNAGMTTDLANTVITTDPTILAQEQTVNNVGVIFGVSMRNQNGQFCTITVNGSLEYTSEGSPDGTYIVKWYWLRSNDKILVTNAIQFESIPLITDNNSPLVILYNQLNQAQLDLADLKASISGKTLDTANTVNIETQTQSGGYTVDNTLGGRIHYTGLNVLITTWALMVNGTAVRNGALLGLGTTQGDYDVNDGDIITTIGMTSVTFTPYKAG